MRTVTSTRSAEAELLADRVPLFGGAWLVLVALITVIETLQGRLHPGLGVGVRGRCTRRSSAARWRARGAANAQAIVIALCGGLAVSIAGTFASFGGSAEILGRSAVRADGERRRLLRLGMARAARAERVHRRGLAARPARLGVSASPFELVGVTAIGWVITVGLAESMARTFRLGVELRERERAAADALQASYDAYRDLAENARDFLWTADLEGRLTYVNESTARLLGDTPRGARRPLDLRLRDRPSREPRHRGDAREGGGGRDACRRNRSSA